MAKRRGYGDQIDRARARVIREALKRHNGNKTHAMWELRIDRRTIQRIAKKYGI